MIITKNQFFGIILILGVIVLSPFYFYQSGMPQPAHIVMLIASLALILINQNQCLKFARENIFIVAFVVLAFIVNSIYFLQYREKIFIINSIYWLYGFLLLLAVICISKDEWLHVWIRKLIFLQFVFILICYLMGWGGFSFWPRYEYFFNGPNQLANYALSMLIIYAVIDKGEMKIGLLAIYFLTAAAIVMTGARSMYIAFLPMTFILLFIARSNFIKQVLIVAIPLVIYYLFVNLSLPWYVPTEAERLAGQNFNVGSNTFNRFKELCIACNSTDYYSIEYQLRARGYWRIIDFPQYIFFGAGQGMDERFGNLDGFTYEIHSSLFGILFYYGIGGLILFLIGIYKAFKNKMNILFMAPIFAYGLFTYGLRSPYFWFVLGFLLFASNILNMNEKIKNR